MTTLPRWIVTLAVLALLYVVSRSIVASLSSVEKILAALVP